MYMSSLLNRTKVSDLHYLDYLGVSSSLRRSTCNDTPQVTVGSHACTLIASHLSPLLDVPKPAVSRTSSWSSAFNSAFYCSRQNVVLTFDMAIVGAFSLLDIS